MCFKKSAKSANLSFASGLLCGRVYRNRKKWSVSRNIAEIFKMSIVYNPGGGVLLGSFGGGVPPASPNPDPISDQKMPFPTPVFRPGLKNPYLF